jgi:hypothetical protein
VKVKGPCEPCNGKNPHQISLVWYLTIAKRDPYIQETTKEISLPGTHYNPETASIPI